MNIIPISIRVIDKLLIIFADNPSLVSVTIV